MVLFHVYTCRMYTVYEYIYVENNGFLITYLEWNLCFFKGPKLNKVVHTFSQKNWDIMKSYQKNENLKSFGTTNV